MLVLLATVQTQLPGSGVIQAQACLQPCGGSTCLVFYASMTCGMLQMLHCSCTGCCRQARSTQANAAVATQPLAQKPTVPPTVTSSACSKPCGPGSSDCGAVLPELTCARSSFLLGCDCTGCCLQALPSTKVSNAHIPPTPPPLMPSPGPARPPTAPPSIPPMTAAALAAAITWVAPGSTKRTTPFGACDIAPEHSAVSGRPTPYMDFWEVPDTDCRLKCAAEPRCFGYEWSEMNGYFRCRMFSVPILKVIPMLTQHQCYMKGGNWKPPPAGTTQVSSGPAKPMGCCVEKPCKRFALPGIPVTDFCSDLSFTDLRGVDLSGSSLIGMDLSGAWLAEAKLAHADFSDVKAFGTSFLGADMTGAILENGEFPGCDFSLTKMQGADLTMSTLTSSNFYGADLQFSTLQETQLDHAVFRYSMLFRANFDSVEGAYADFSQANLILADFSNGNFPGAIFRGANLGSALFRNTELRGADFTGSYNTSQADFASITGPPIGLHYDWLNNG